MGAILLFVSGDLDWACNELGLQHWGRPTPCCFCAANNTDKLLNDFTASAAWRSSVYTNGQFKRRVRKPYHPLAAWPAFNRHTYRIDLLHTLDHNGVAGVVLGNVFWAHLRRPSLVLPGDTQEGRMQFLNDDIRGFYHQNSVANRLPRLSISNVIRRGTTQSCGGGR